MGKKALAFGLLLILSAIAAFIQNFGFWHFWIIGDFGWFWNPIGYFVTPKLTGGIPIVGGIAASVVNGLIALLYSFALGIVGAFAVLKR